MLDTILLPTDGSEGAIRAANHAATLARATDATVHVVNVVDARQYSSISAEFDGVGDEQQERLRERGREAIASVEDALGDDVQVVTELLRGVPHERILDHADEVDADLVVMGTHGRTGLDRLLVGSTTERVVRSGDRPVLTVGPDAEPTDGYRDVLVPTDGSAGVVPAVECALDLAEAFDATVHALSVVDVRTFLADADYGVTAADAAVEALREQAEGATAEVADRAAERGLDVETEVVNAVPTGAILDYADERDVDLIVMGTRGRSGLDRYVLGSVTENVLRKAACPVLSVHRRDEE